MVESDTVSYTHLDVYKRQRYGFIGTVDSTIANPVATAALFLIGVNALLGVITYRLLASGWKLKA